MEIKKIYNEVVTGCKYDFEVASKHNMEMISSDVKASDLPHIEADFVTQNHVGCCLHYGMTLFAKTGKGEYFDIPIEQFLKEQGTIWMFDPYGEYGNESFFREFLSHPIEILEEGE